MKVTQYITYLLVLLQTTPHTTTVQIGSYGQSKTPITLKLSYAGFQNKQVSSSQKNCNSNSIYVSPNDIPNIENPLKLSFRLRLQMTCTGKNSEKAIMVKLTKESLVEIFGGKKFNNVAISFLFINVVIEKNSDFGSQGFLLWADAVENRIAGNGDYVYSESGEESGDERETITSKLWPVSVCGDVEELDISGKLIRI